MAALTLIIVSQKRKVAETSVRQVSAPSTQGEITLLPNHIPLFTQLEAGIVRYTDDADTEHFLVISAGFLTLDESGTITIMIDSATDEREISAEKAQEAIDAAKQTLSKKASLSPEELVRAEAELRKSLLEMKVARGSKRRQS